MQLHTTVRVLTWPACDGRGAGHGCTAPDTTTAAAPPCARISCCSPATQHISTSAHYPSTPAIVCHHSWHHEEWYCTRTCSFGTLFYYMACTPAPRTFSAAHSLHPGTVLYIYLLQTHTVRREGSRPRIIAMRFALHNGGPWRRSLRATRVTRIPIRKAGARTLALTIAAPAIVRGAGGGLACTCQAGAFQRWGVRTTHLVLHHFLTAGKDVGAAASWGGGDNECAWNEVFSPPTTQRARPEGRKTASCG